MRLCCPICPVRSPSARRSHRSPPTAPAAPAAVATPSRTEARTRSPSCLNQWRTRLAPAPTQCQAVEGGQPRRRGGERGPARREAPRPDHLAPMERIPPPKPRRDRDEPHEAARPDAHGTRLRTPDRRTPGPHRRPQSLYRDRHPRHAARRPTFVRERGSPAISRFVQQGQSDFLCNCAMSSNLRGLCGVSDCWECYRRAPRSIRSRCRSQRHVG